jgi:hypothetical protein
MALTMGATFSGAIFRTVRATRITPLLARPLPRNRQPLPYWGVVCLSERHYVVNDKFVPEDPFWA